jgi:hypothetical protein
MADLPSLFFKTGASFDFIFSKKLFDLLSFLGTIFSFVFDTSSETFFFFK